MRVSVAEDRGRCLLTPGPPSLFASSIRSLVHPSTATRGSRRLRPVRPHVGTSDFRACNGEGEKLGWGGRWGWGSGLTQQRPGGEGAAARAGGHGRAGREVTPGLLSGVVAASCPTLQPHGLPGSPILRHLVELAQTHVHRVSDAIQPSHACRPLLFLPSVFLSIRVFSKESALCINWPKYWSFSISTEGVGRC